MKPCFFLFSFRNIFFLFSFFLLKKNLRISAYLRVSPCISAYHRYITPTIVITTSHRFSYSICALYIWFLILPLVYNFISNGSLKHQFDSSLSPVTSRFRREHTFGRSICRSVDPSICHIFCIITLTGYRVSGLVLINYVSVHMFHLGIK